MKAGNLTTLARQERTSEQLFSEASFRLSGASFRLAVRCLAGGLGSWASPGSEGLMVTGQDGIKTQETLAGEGPGKGWPYREYDQNIIYTHG